MFLLVPAFCFFVVASSSGMSIGSRHILPVYAFTIVLAGAGAVWFSRKLYYFRYFLAALLVYHAAVAARTAPNYIPFSNDFWGGYENTYRILGKDDADFGGSIKQVNEYLSRENINDCWVAAVDLFKYEPPCRAMPSAAALGTGRDLIDPIPPVIDGTVILGVRQIPPEGGDEFAPIAESQPIAFIGGTKFVHRGRFEVPLMAAISHVHRSNYFLRVNDIDQAIAEARQAVELAPVDPRPHLAFGLALVQAGQKEESKHEFEATINLAKSNPRFRSQAVQAQKELDRMNQ